MWSSDMPVYLASARRVTRCNGSGYRWIGALGIASLMRGVGPKGFSLAFSRITSSGRIPARRASSSEGSTGE